MIWTKQCLEVSHKISVVFSHSNERCITQEHRKFNTLFDQHEVVFLYSCDKIYMYKMSVFF